ncbi:MAG: hypothetical protein IKA46_02885 [Clostridia bacterium]|nr:hypothetical protein [Clostridia bacterium]MBR3862732.1 hypothetical protein [Clostridia bacterium]
MSQITKPLFLDETGQEMLQALRDIAAKCGEGGATELSLLKEDVESIKRRLGILEDQTGTVYFYDSVVDEILDSVDFNDLESQWYSIEIDGIPTLMDEDFFHNKCTHVNFGGTGDESGAYLFFYERSVKLSFYEAFFVYVNGEDIAYACNGPEYFTYTAPQVLHITLHD